MTSQKFCTLLSCLVILSSCTQLPPHAPQYQRLESSSSDKTNVYIFRSNAYPELRTPNVFIDGQSIFEPPEHAYTVVALTEGTHHVLVKWPWDIAVQRKFPILVQKNTPLYIKLTGVFLVKLMSQQEAEVEIKMCCRYIENTQAANHLEHP